MPTLNWIGKEAVVEHHQQVPFHLLRCNAELSVGEAGSGNLLIEGDNLLALKALLPYYARQVKCIYIDPPYNTGNENWVYNDNVSSPEILEWLGQTVGKEAEDLSRHDKWLCMMYPRLVLLHKLLHEEGSLWMSIDDNEVHHARGVLDEVFGALNFITTISWQKIYTVKSSARHFSEMHDYILVYAKDSQLWNRNLLPRTETLILRKNQGFQFKAIFHDQGIVVCSSLNLLLFKEGDDGTTIQSGSNGEQHMFWPPGSPWILCAGARSVGAYSTSCPLRWTHPLPGAH